MLTWLLEICGEVPKISNYKYQPDEQKRKGRIIHILSDLTITAFSED